MISRLGFLPFVGALSRLDNYLLLHHRMLWISKIHYVLYATTLLTLPLTLAALLVPISTASGVPNWLGVYWLTGALGAIGGVYWAYRQTLFHIGGQYGNLPRFMAAATLGLYLVCGAAFVGMTLLPWAVIHSRGAAVISESDLDKDRCKLNEQNVYFTCYNPEGYSISVWHAEKAAEPLPESSQTHFEEIVSSSRTYFGTTYQRRGFSTRHSSCGNEYDKTTEKDFLNDIDVKALEEYIRLFGKYGGKIETDAKQVVQAFKAKSDLFTGRKADYILEQKAKVRDNIASIFTSKITIKDMKYYLTAISVLVYYFAIIVWAFAVMGRMEAILTIASAAILLPLSINIAMFVLPIVREQNVLFYGYLLLMAAGVAIAALNRRNYSLLSLILAGYAAGGLPFLILVSAQMIGISISNDNATFLILSSLGLHATLILPWMHGRFVRMKALPRI